MKNPEFLLLLTVPLLILFGGLKGLGERKGFFYAVSACRKKGEAASLFCVKYIYLMILCFSAFVLLVTALASPVIHVQGHDGGNGFPPAFTRDTILLFDISRSMLSDDGGGRSRLEKAVDAASGLLSSGGGRFGVVVFKGASFTLVPLTGNRGAVLDAVMNLSPDIYTETGTDIGEGLMKAISALPDHEKTEKRIYLFTDGEEPEKGCFHKCRDEIAGKMAKMNVLLCVIPPDKKTAQAVPGTEIISEPDMKMIGMLEKLPGAVIVEAENLDRLLKQPEDTYPGAKEKDLSLFFAAAGLLLLLSALLIKGTRWQGII